VLAAVEHIKLKHVPDAEGFGAVHEIVAGRR
jgi:hypothetical protein